MRFRRILMDLHLHAGRHFDAGFPQHGGGVLLQRLPESVVGPSLRDHLGYLFRSVVVFSCHIYLVLDWISWEHRSPDWIAPSIQPGYADVWSPAKCTRPSGSGASGTKRATWPGLHQMQPPRANS